MTVASRVLKTSLALCLAALIVYIAVNTSDDNSDLPIANPVKSFPKWVDRYVNSQVASSSFVDLGVRLAKQRAHALQQLMRSDAQAVMDARIPENVRAQLPEAVREHVEQTKAGYATVTVTAAYVSRNESTYFHSVDFLDGSHYEGFMCGLRWSIPFPSAVPMWGIIFGDQIVIAEDPVRNLTRGEALTRSAEQDLVDPITMRAASPHVAADLGGQLFYFEDTVSRSTFNARKLHEHRQYLATRTATNQARQSINVLILIIQFSDLQAPTSVGAFTTYFSHIRQYWITNSYGCVDMHPFFTPVLTMPSTAASYSSNGNACPISSSNAPGSQMDVDARNTAATMGYSVNNYDRYAIIFSAFSACQWLGLAVVSGTQAWINGATDPSADWHVYAHEMGHNYGLKHANQWLGDNAPGPPTGTNGQSLPYYDEYDVMGGAAQTGDFTNLHINAYKKYGMGWIPSTEVTSGYSVNTGACTQSTNGGPCNYRIYAHDRIDAVPSRALRIQQQGQLWVWLDVRQTLDIPTAAPYFANGVTFHNIQDPGITATEIESMLMDMTYYYVDSNPWSTALENSPLQIGASFYDSSLSYSVVPTFRGVSNRGLQYMDVAVWRGTLPTAPTVSGGITASCSTPGVGVPVQFSITATTSATATGNYPNPKFNLNYFWQFGDQLFGTVNSNSVYHSYAAAGTYSVNVTVSDGYGNAVFAGPTTVTVGGNGCACSNTCGGHGTCMGGSGACVCNYNYTDAACGTDLLVAAALPAYGPIAGGTTVTVTTTQSVFSSTVQALCSFRPYGIVAATFVSGTSVTCVSPATVLSVGGTQAVEVEVSPNGGVDWSQSRTVFSYGVTGLCPAGCGSAGTYGTCNAATGVCKCAAGYTGLTCTTAIAISPSGLSATFGPSTGGTLLTITGTPMSGMGTTFYGSGGCSDVLVRFNDTTSSAVTYVQGMVTSTPSVTVYTPAAPMASTTAVAIDVSPNRGVDWTTTGAIFSYQPVTTLYDGLQRTGDTVASNSLTFYQFFHGDPTISFTVAVTGAANNVVVYFGFGVVPYLPVGGGNLCAGGSPFYQCSTPGTSVSTFFDATTSIYAGTYYIAVGATMPETYNILVTNSESATKIITIQAGASGSEAGYLASGTRFYRILAGGNAFATSISLTPESVNSISNSALSMGINLGSAVTSPGRTGNPIVIQACENSNQQGAYYITVTGPGVYQLSATQLELPSGQGALTTSTGLTTVQVTWLNAAPAAGQTSAGITYTVYYKTSSTTIDLNDTCLMEANTKGSAALQQQTINTATISGLDPVTAYSVNVEITDSRGVKGQYTQAIARTIPTSIPTNTLIIIGCVVGGVIVLCLILLIIYRKCRTSQRKRKPKKPVQVLTVKAKAKASFSPQAKGELKFKKNEILILIGHPTKQGWIVARNRSKEQGIVPFSYFRVQKNAASAYRKNRV